jgi:hypothetical protein
MKIEKTKHKVVRKPIDALYIFLVIVMIGFMLLIASHGGATVTDCFFMLVFAYVVVKLRLLRFSRKYFFDGSIEWVNPGLFFLLLIVTCVFAIAVDVIFFSHH